MNWLSLETCQELQRKGFRQDTEFVWYWFRGIEEDEYKVYHRLAPRTKRWERLAPCPTSDELMEALKDGPSRVWVHADSDGAAAGRDIMGPVGFDPEKYALDCNSPVEALAALWIEVFAKDDAPTDT